MGFNCLFFLSVMLPSVLPRLGTDSAVRMFPGVGNFFLFKTLFLGWSSVPPSFVSFFVFYIFFLPPFEDNGLLFWVPDVLCWHSEVVFTQRLNVLLMNFVGEKVFSLSYSSATLAPPPLNFLISVSPFIIITPKYNISLSFNDVCLPA